MQVYPQRLTALGNRVMLAQAMTAGNSGESPLMVSPAVHNVLTAFPVGSGKLPGSSRISSLVHKPAASLVTE